MAAAVGGGPARSVTAEIGKRFFSWAALHTDTTQKNKDPADTRGAACGSVDSEGCVKIQRAHRQAAVY